MSAQFGWLKNFRILLIYFLRGLFCLFFLKTFLETASRAGVGIFS